MWCRGIRFHSLATNAARRPPESLLVDAAAAADEDGSDSERAEQTGRRQINVIERRSQTGRRTLLKASRRGDWMSRSSGVEMVWEFKWPLGLMMMLMMIRYAALGLCGGRTQGGFSSEWNKMSEKCQIVKLNASPFGVGWVGEATELWLANGERMSGGSMMGAGRLRARPLTGGVQLRCGWRIYWVKSLSTLIALRGQQHYFREIHWKMSFDLGLETWTLNRVFIDNL